MINKAQMYKIAEEVLNFFRKKKAPLPKEQGKRKPPLVDGAMSLKVYPIFNLYFSRMMF